MKIKNYIYCLVVLLSFSVIALTQLLFWGKDKYYITRKEDYNLILIVVDSLRADHLPFYGYSKNTSPFLNEFFKDSFIFKNCFSQYNNTSPSVISLLTSRFASEFLLFERPREFPIKARYYAIPDAFPTLPKVLKNNGYTTIGVSANPFLFADAIAVIGENLSAGFDFFYDIKPVEAERFFWKADGSRVFSMATQSILKENTPKKFFMYIHTMDVHMPYDVASPNETDINLLIPSYDNAILKTDTLIKSFVSELKDRGILDKTILIFTADHGEQFYEHGVYGHGTALYREETHVPLIIRIPETNGSVVTTNVMLLDLFPTILDLLRIESPNIVLGKSLMQQGKTLSEFSNRDIFMEHFFADNTIVRAIRTDKYLYILGQSEKDTSRAVKYKYVYLDGSGWNYRQLYSYLKDHEEKKNIILTESPKTIFQLESKLIFAFSQRLKEEGKFLTETIFNDGVKAKTEDKELIERLKGLGYME